MAHDVAAGFVGMFALAALAVLLVEISDRITGRDTKL